MSTCVYGLFIPFGSQRSAPNAVTYNIITTSNNQRSSSLYSASQPIYRAGRVRPSVLRSLARFRPPGVLSYFNRDCDLWSEDFATGNPYYGLFAGSNFNLRTLSPVPLIAGAQTFGPVYVPTGFI